MVYHSRHTLLNSSHHYAGCLASDRVPTASEVFSQAVVCFAQLLIEAIEAAEHSVTVNKWPEYRRYGAHCDTVIEEVGILVDKMTSNSRIAALIAQSKAGAVGRSVVSAACSNHDLVTLQSLLAADLPTESALEDAGRCGGHTLVQPLAAAGATLGRGLLLAVQANETATATAMVKYLAVGTDNALEALVVAVSRKQLSCVRALLDSRLPLSEPCAGEGRTLAHVAAKSGSRHELALVISRAGSQARALMAMEAMERQIKSPVHRAVLWTVERRSKQPHADWRNRETLLQKLNPQARQAVLEADIEKVAETLVGLGTAEIIRRQRPQVEAAIDQLEEMIGLLHNTAQIDILKLSRQILFMCSTPRYVVCGSTGGAVGAQ